MEYQQVYPGVNLVYYGNQRQLEYDFVVSPGADPRTITLAFEGTDGLAIDAQGDLVLRADAGEVRLRKPVVYQDHDGQRTVIPARYIIKGERQVAFEVATYDGSHPLIIDPVLAYSTYLGGSGADGGLAIAVDRAGNAYVTGTTFLGVFPTTTGASDTTLGGSQDAFVARLNPAGSGVAALVYSTYLGGSDLEEGMAIAVDADGNAYVTGSTTSANFPTTAGAFDTTCGTDVNGSCNFFAGFSFSDAFVAKLDPTDSVLIYSTYLGGDRDDSGHGIAVDGGNAYVTGATSSTNFPGTVQPTFGGGDSDAFVAKLDATGSALLYSTYLGGSGRDVASGIAVDGDCNAYVTGHTFSGNFPTAGAFQTNHGGSADAFLAKFNSGGDALVFSSYLGGLPDDSGRGIAVDAAGNAYVTGVSSSDNFATLGAFQTSPGGSADAFVTKISQEVTVTFENVAQDGLTTLTTSTAGPTPPAGFKLGDPATYYELTTTAIFNGSVTVCIHYTRIAFGDEASLKLTHFDGQNWVDATPVSLDTEKNIICGRVNSLSFFAIFAPATNATNPFAAFHAGVEIENERHAHEFDPVACGAQGEGGLHFDPFTEPVSFQVGTFFETIPAGSFRQDKSGRFKFERVLDNDVALEVVLRPLGGSGFELRAEGEGADLTGTVSPVEVSLTIGNDSGETVAATGSRSRRSSSKIPKGSHR